MSEWVIKFNGLSGYSGQRGPYSPYKPCNHSLYIRIIIFPHIDNTQSTGHNSPFHEISASWHCLEFQPITGAAALQCGTVCCYHRQAAGDLKEMHWKVVAENEVVDVRSVFTRVNLTVGTIQKVVTELQIRKMFTDLEVIRLYWPCHLLVSPACTAQFCTRCAVH